MAKEDAEQNGEVTVEEREEMSPLSTMEPDGGDLEDDGPEDDDE
ncbi:hypothetical protein [Streptomyces sp. NPDC059003]